MKAGFARAELSPVTAAGRITSLVLLGLLLVGIVGSVSGATTPGGNGLIVYAQELRGQYQLFTIRPDGSGSRQLTHGLNAVNPDWSPDGREIVLELDRDKSAGIAVMAAEGTGMRNLTPKGFQGQPSYSPDGSSIVYERDLAPGDSGVWLMSVDGSGKRRVTRSPFGCCDTDPNFSPDGRLITFVRVKKPGRLQALFAVRPDGTGLRQLTPYSWEVAIKHDWSPDGKLIVLTTNADFVRPRESANLVTIRPDGSGIRRLTDFTGGKKNAFAGSFSPDGKQIVFRLEQGGTYSLAVVDREGQHLRLLTKPSNDKPRFIDWGTHR